MKKEDFFIDHDKLVLKALANSTVAIAGAGGLGSNCAVALARSGIGKMIICDHDKIEASNLNRQYYFKDQVGLYKIQALKTNLKRINPFSTYEVHQKKLCSIDIQELFEDADIIIEAFDSADQKQMLVETWSDYFSDIPLIIASGIAGFGKNAEIKQQNSGNLYWIGDEVSDTDQGFKPMAPRVAIVANMQANLAIELLVKIKAGKGII